MKSIERGTLVVLTHNHRARLLKTVLALRELPEKWPIIVVDNGSDDDTATAVQQAFPDVLLIRSRRNIGAAARNIAAAYAHTPYIAFCDDDMLWQPGALQRAAGILDGHARIGVVSGCVLEGDAGRIDPLCIDMARSPLERENLPGPQLLGFKPESCVMRTRAFYEAGGFWPPLFAGGAESLLALDMANLGWRMVYMDDVIARRPYPASPQAPYKLRRELRNAIWVAWMRLPAQLAWVQTLQQLRKAAELGQLRSVLLQVFSGMPRVLHRRQVISPRVSAMWASLYGITADNMGERPAQPSQRSMV